MTIRSGLQMRCLRYTAYAAVVLACATLSGCGTPDDFTPTGQVGEIESLSTVGGWVSRSETLTRAQRWVDLHVMYSKDQSNAAGDGDGHNYRPDCSGMVSMDWHLPKKSNGWDLNTGDFGSYSGKTNISWDALLPGDAILGVNYGHIALFDRWTDGSDTAMWIYQENQSGTPANYATQTRSWYVANGFQPIRYNNIFDDCTAGTVTQCCTCSDGYFFCGCRPNTVSPGNYCRTSCGD